jgi:hypothetical protein
MSDPSAVRIDTSMSNEDDDDHVVPVFRRCISPLALEKRVIDVFKLTPDTFPCMNDLSRELRSLSHQELYLYVDPLGRRSLFHERVCDVVESGRDDTSVCGFDALYNRSQMCGTCHVNLKCVVMKPCGHVLECIQCAVDRAYQSYVISITSPGLSPESRLLCPCNGCTSNGVPTLIQSFALEHYTMKRVAIAPLYSAASAFKSTAPTRRHVFP